MVKIAEGGAAEMKKTDENEYGAPEAKQGGLQIIARIVCLLLAFAIWLYVVDNDSDDYEKTLSLSRSKARRRLRK